MNLWACGIPSSSENNYSIKKFPGSIENLISPDVSFFGAGNIYGF